MALYHFTAKAVSMGKGQSAVHTAAYNARCQLHDERENRDTKDYGYKGKTEFSGIFAPKDAPKDAPDWTRDREQLWNRATAAERQANGQPTRNVEFALPHELNAEQRRRLVTDFAREAFARRGMVADVSIHEPHDRNDDRNYHVHCLLTMRRLDGENFARTKDRQWNSKDELAHWREKWAQMGARALERAGHPQEAERFLHGHKTLAGQREAALARGDKEWAAQCDKEAQIHKGAAISSMERRNDGRLVDNEKARESRAIDDRNAARAAIKETEKELAAVRQEAKEQREAEQPKPKPEPEPEKAQPRAERWQNRDATKMEEKLFHMQDAAERAGRPLGADLWQEGITLARVDRAGIDAKDADYRRAFEQEKLQGNADARLRRSVVQEGELVAVTKSGDVFRLNPRFLELDKLERAATGGTTPSLSATLDYMAQARAQERSDFWQRRDMTDMETKVTAIHETASRQGAWFGAALYEEGMTLARVDRAGIAAKDAEYRRAFDNEKLQGNADARLRRSVVQEGELVAVTKSGDVFRLNPRFVDRERLERDFRGGEQTPMLSDALRHFATARQQQKDDRAAARETIREAKETQRDRAAFAHGIRQGAKDAFHDLKGSGTGFKVVDAKGFVTSLASFIENLWGDASPAPGHQQDGQQHAPQGGQGNAYEAMEEIYERSQRGEDLSAESIRNLPAACLQNLRSHGDAYMHNLIRDFEREKEQEAARSWAEYDHDRMGRER